MTLTESPTVVKPRSRRTATIVGVLFLVQTGSYLFGDALFRSAVEPVDFLANLNEGQVQIGVFLQFVNTVAVVGIGVLMFPVLRRYRESMALGYTATKILEAALLLVSGVFALLVVPMSREYLTAEVADASQLQILSVLTVEGYTLAFQLAMIALGAGSLLFMYVLYEFELVPRALSLLGALGYVALFASGWLEIAGSDIAMVLYAPGALFELAFPLWLIFRGFNGSAVVGGAVE